MQDVQNLHMDQNKWADVGYHYGIDGKGTIYEGRDIHVRGSSVAGHNTGTIGIVLMGDFDHEEPAQEQLASLLTLVQWLTTAYHLTHFAGQSEVSPATAFPGANLPSYRNTQG